MSNQVLSSQQLRSHSANPTNYKNIEVHAYLDDAKAYRNKVDIHLSKSKFQNHVLQSAERFYQKEYELRPSSSQSSFNRRSKVSASTKGDLTGYGFLNLQSKINPESRLVSGLSQKAFRISEIKNGFDSGIQEKEDLKKRIEGLKQKIVQEKNKKAKISIRNCKLMNAAESSNYRSERLQQQSRRNNILINEVFDEVKGLEDEVEQLRNRNRVLRQSIGKEDDCVRQLSETVQKTKQQLERERKLMQIWKQKQTVSYKSMTNEYMNMNKLKEQKALLLNCIDIDVKNSL